MAESYSHKYFKDNLVKIEDTIQVSGNDYKILSIDKEVDLGKFFKVKFDKKIIVDLLINTSGGYVVIEILYTHGRCWTELKPYFDKLNLLEVFEVSVPRDIRGCPTWTNFNKLLINESVVVRDNYPEYGEFYFGRNSLPFKVDDNSYQIKCMHPNFHTSKQFKTITLQFDLNDKYITEDRILNNFKTDYMLISKVTYYYTNKQNLYFVKSFYNPKIVRPDKYNAETMRKVLDRLNKLTVQTSKI